MVPNDGNYFGRDEFIITNKEGIIRVISNICRHRQAKMFDGCGTADRLMCPVHKWTYGLDGKMIGAPNFPLECKLDLMPFNFGTWNGLLFDRPVDLHELDGLFDFTDYEFDHHETHFCPYDWKIFVEVSMDCYHVRPYHRGLGSYVTDQVRWVWGKNCSAQIVGHKSLDNPGSPIYEEWFRELKKLPPIPWGAIWGNIYPNAFIEHYPYTIMISYLTPRPDGVDFTIDYFYDKQVDWLYKQTQRDAFMETVMEDDQIAMRLQAGRRFNTPLGPTHPELECGIDHFYAWLNKNS